MSRSSSGVTQRDSFFFPWARIFAAWRAWRRALAVMILFSAFGRMDMVLILIPSKRRFYKWLIPLN